MDGTIDHTRQQTGKVTAKQLKSIKIGVSFLNTVSAVAVNRGINEATF